MSDFSSGGAGDDSQNDIRRLVAKRLAMAAGLVAVLLGGLAVFDHLSSQAVQDELTTYDKPVPVAQRKEMTQPVTVAPSEPVPEEKEKLPVQVIPEGTAGLSAKDTLAEPLPRSESPVPQEKPSREAGRASSPGAAVAPARGPANQARSAPATAAAPTASAPTVAVVPPAGTPQPMPRSSIPDEAAIAAGAPRPVLKEGATSKAAQSPAMAASVPQGAPPVPAIAEVAPTARVVAKPAVPVASSIGAPRLFSGFVLQAGVFSSTKGAEELHAKLNLHGIPSTLETRVHVGPFKTRAEAEAAQHKMQALGIDPVLLTPKGSKR